MKREDIEKIWITSDAVFIRTKEGKEAYERLADYPSLRSATAAELKNYRLSVYGIHWNELDEDLSFESFFMNKKFRNQLNENAL